MAKKTKTRMLTEVHHRRPRSIGGTETPGNISNVVREPHEHYHTLFGNMNAYQICNHINNMEQKPKQVVVECKFINGTEVKKNGSSHSHDKLKVTHAWESLFKGLTFVATINYINNVWLDPSYHMYIVRKNKKKRSK